LTARQQPTRAREFASRLTVILPGRGRAILSPAGPVPRVPWPGSAGPEIA